MRFFAILLLIPLLAACRNPDVREDAVVSPPDTAVVDEPLYDPDQLDDRPGATASTAEIEARRTILSDPSVTEAQVMLAADTVRVTAVLLEPGAGDAELKARQFAGAAYRHLERPAVTPDTDIIGASRYTYDVTIRDHEGRLLFRGIKGRQDDQITRLQGNQN